MCKSPKEMLQKMLKVPDFGALFASLSLSLSLSLLAPSLSASPGHISLPFFRPYSRAREACRRHCACALPRTFEQTKPAQEPLRSVQGLTQFYKNPAQATQWRNYSWTALNLACFVLESWPATGIHLPCKRTLNANFINIKNVEGAANA